MVGVAVGVAVVVAVVVAVAVVVGVAVGVAVEMIKQMISFTDPQRSWLRREAKRLGISAAELVRRAVDAYRTAPHEDDEEPDNATRPISLKHRARRR